MKKINITIALTLCFTLLTACGGNAGPETTDGDFSAMSQTNTPIAQSSTHGETDTAEGQVFLTPEYNYEDNQLVLLNLSTDAVTASYSFEKALTPMLTEKVSGGVVMLASQAEADVQNKDGVSAISVDDSAETLVCWRFDDKMNLVKQYELTDPLLVESLWGCTFDISPDGKEIAYAVGDCLYVYVFETQKHSEITSKAAEDVYYDAIRYSAGGRYLAFFGSLPDREGTAYGSVDLNDGSGKVFFADGFFGMTLSVNGDYAVISDTIKPASMGGPAESGSILYLDLAEQQGRQIAVQSGAESGIASVSADGCYIVTCKGGDGTDGVLTGYRTENGEKVIEQPYTMNTACKPYKILIQEKSAYAVLVTDNGELLSPALLLP